MGSTSRNRATFGPDYGRRGKLWVHGAFEPATGQATMVLSPSRDSLSHIQLLEKIVTEFPADRWLIIEDNLSIHISRETRLALTAWPDSHPVHPQVRLLAQPDRALVEAVAIPGSQRTAIRDLGRIDRNTECGFGLLELSSASLSLEEEASRTSDPVGWLWCQCCHPDITNLAREPLKITPKVSNIWGSVHSSRPLGG